MFNTTKQSPQYQAPAQPYIPAQVYNIPSAPMPTYPAQPVQQNEGWWKRNQKNKPQSNSVGTASLIFISGGMNMAWNLGFPLVQTTFFVFAFNFQHLILSWFIGGIIGVVVGAFACNYIPKKYLMGAASILVTICGILQVSNPNSYQAILASRYLNGIAVGLIFPMTFVLIGEEVVKSLRGINAASVDTMCFSCGIFIQTIYSTSWSDSFEDSFQAIQMSGVLNIIYGVLAFIMGSLFIIESPIFYLSRGDELMAIDTLRRLQRPYTITYETYAQLEEHKLYLAESKEKTIMQNALYGIPALLKLCFYRSFMALGFSYFVNFAFTYSSYETTKFEGLPYFLYAAAKWIGPLLAAFTLDSKGRKSPMIVGFFISTILAFIVGGIYYNTLNFTDFDAMNTVKYVLIFYQLFASMSMVSSSAYLSEAFPLAVKPYYVAIVFIVEMLVHIIIISCKGYYFKSIFHISDYFFALGSLSLVFLGVAIFTMPETKWCSLRECLPKFRQINNLRK